MDDDEEKIVATVEGCFFKYNFIKDYGIDIIDLADSISGDTCQAITTLENNSLFTKEDIEYRSLICYLRRLYVYPKYRNNSVATYIYNNLREIFEYITSDQISIIITLPCPQNPISGGRWGNTGDEIMLEKMVKLLNKQKYKFLEDGVYYKSYI